MNRYCKCRFKLKVVFHASDILHRLWAAYADADGRTTRAAEFGLSRHHLTKIMHRLAKAGYVSTRRGAGGGAVLARPASEIRLGSVVRLLEEGQPLVECFESDGGNCSIGSGCRLKGRLRLAQAAFLADLDRSTLADIAIGPGAPTALPA
jgi:Rrf2 family transcriptional regulator, nitric oxide-sensitive transcriptional repressor